MKCSSGIVIVVGADFRELFISIRKTGGRKAEEKREWEKRITYINAIGDTSITTTDAVSAALERGHKASSAC